jgi:hypothetical protein
MEGIEPFLFVLFASFLYSVDIHGYSFMSAATLFATGAVGDIENNSKDTL